MMKRIQFSGRLLPEKSTKISLDKEEYVQKFKPDLMELTLSWCEGCKFKELCDEARDIYEGTIVRAFRRLDELIS